MEGEGATSAGPEQQSEAPLPEHQMQPQLKSQLQPQVQAEPMPMEGISSYEQHMPGNEVHMGHPEAHLQGQMMDPNMVGMPPGEHPHMIGVPAGLSTLHSMSGQELDMGEDGNGDDPPAKFKPINLERLSPKSKQRVLRNRQAATRSKAKKKQQFQVLKDKKTGLDLELEQLEAQIVATEQRMGALHSENKALMDACKCGPSIAQEQ